MTIPRCNIMMSQQIQDDGRPPGWKSLCRHISAKYHLVHNSRFGTERQSRDKKMKILKIVRWQTAIIMKIVLGHYSAADCPIFAKYSVGKHDSCQSRSDCKFWKFNTSDGTILKIVYFLSRHRNEKSSDFDEYGTQQQIWNSMTVTQRNSGINIIFF